MYARTALPTALPEALSYRVPDELASLAVPGVRVRVRVRGQARVGVVAEVVADPGCPPERVLPLEEVLDPEPLLPPHVLELIRFAADYYAAPLGSVVRAAIPAALLRVPPPIVQAGARAAEMAASADPAARRLLERVLEARRISVVRLRAEGWSKRELDELLPALAEKHALRVVERSVAGPAGSTVWAVVLSEMSPEERAQRVGAARAQARAVAWLAETGRPVLEGELLAACGCTAGVVGALVRKGIVRRFQQARQREARRWELKPGPPPEELTASQLRAVGALSAALDRREFSAFLLQGVTGSGKTEVYLRAAAAAVERGAQALVLVPEIALTPALAGQLARGFAGRVAVLHSSMAEGERLAAWERARRGQVDVVAGPRSALWAPLARLGVVVVDEEQDSSYKQEEEPRYNARDLALALGQRLRVPVVLASATPSLEVLSLAEQGKVEILDLPERVAGGRLPEVEVVDLKGEPPEPGEHGQRFLSRRLRGALADTLARGEQTILLVNRRGWAPVLLCRECGHQAACRDCSIPLTVHRRRAALVCHYCGFRSEIPERCPRCGGEVLDHVGAGTEKIAALVRQLHPDAVVDILDRDTARSPAQLLATLERFAARESSVLVGTQMVSKGHHFPSVTLTGVVNADNLLGFPDFRGAERTFQMLTQVAGRAGRGERPGLVVIQSYHPDHHAVRSALAHDIKGFAEEELRFRRAFRYPPATRLALVRFEAAGESAAVAAAQAAARALEPAPPGLRVIGPAPAPLERLRGRWRVQILLTAPARPPLRAALAAVAALQVPRAVHRVIDVDPQSTV
ncbi:MAG TPA: primosomal protein N' [Thermoanaerobaculaceae bacterium]|nr:primosomal protein N' [Thermoanaerobaculaceae bacterium]